MLYVQNARRKSEKTHSLKNVQNDCVNKKKNARHVKLKRKQKRKQKNNARLKSVKRGSIRA